MFFKKYNFNCEILKIDYYLALWNSKESLVLNSSIRLESLDSEGKWALQKVFLPKFMSKDKNNRARMVIGRIDLIKNE